MSDYGIDRTKWAELSILEQMGNIGSEVGRAIENQKNGKLSRRNSAVDRAIDLFDATADAWARKKSPRTKEILRAKEQFLSLFFLHFDEDEAKGIERYFAQFATAARQ